MDKRHIRAGKFSGAVVRGILANEFFIPRQFYVQEVNEQSTPEVYLSSLMDRFNEFPISLTLKGTFSLPIYFFQDALEMHFITNYLKY